MSSHEYLEAFREQVAQLAFFEDSIHPRLYDQRSAYCVRPDPLRKPVADGDAMWVVAQLHAEACVEGAATVRVCTGTTAPPVRKSAEECKSTTQAAAPSGGSGTATVGGLPSQVQAIAQVLSAGAALMTSGTYTSGEANGADVSAMQVQALAQALCAGALLVGTTDGGRPRNQGSETPESQSQVTTRVLCAGASLMGLGVCNVEPVPHAEVLDKQVHAFSQMLSAGAALLHWDTAKDALCSGVECSQSRVHAIAQVLCAAASTLQAAAGDHMTAAQVLTATLAQASRLRPETPVDDKDGFNISATDNTYTGAERMKPQEAHVTRKDSPHVSRAPEAPDESAKAFSQVLNATATLLGMGAGEDSPSEGTEAFNARVQDITQVLLAGTSFLRKGTGHEVSVAQVAEAYSAKALGFSLEYSAKEKDGFCVSATNNTYTGAESSEPQEAATTRKIMPHVPQASRAPRYTTASPQGLCHQVPPANQAQTARSGQGTCEVSTAQLQQSRGLQDQAPKRQQTRQPCVLPPRHPNPAICTSPPTPQVLLPPLSQESHCSFGPPTLCHQEPRGCLPQSLQDNANQQTGVGREVPAAPVHTHCLSPDFLALVAQTQAHPAATASTAAPGCTSRPQEPPAAGNVQGLSAADVALHDVPPARRAASKILLKIPVAMWNACLKDAFEIRVLRAGLTRTSDLPVLDLTVPATAISASYLTHTDEALRMAEICCGGFSGWTQAAFTLPRPCRGVTPSWMMDIDADTLPCVRPMHHQLVTAEDEASLQEVMFDDATLFLLADLREEWWERTFAGRRTDLLAVSLPCQAWSRAASQPGLRSEDGRLILRLLEVLAFQRVPVVAFENVPGMAEHTDWPLILEAWSIAGYHLHWQQVVDLGQTGPTTRKRLLAVFVHNQFRGSPSCQNLEWLEARQPSMCTARAYFPDLPSALLAAAQVTEDDLQKYLDPCLAPASWHRPGTFLSPDTMKSRRIRRASQQAPTFQALYGSQHLLSDARLQRHGLLGVLLSDGSLTRLYSVVEVHAAHALLRPLFVPLQKETHYKMAGNAIATQHAAVALAIAHNAVSPQDKRLDPALAAHKCRIERFRHGRAIIVAMDSGWILTPPCHMPALLAQQEGKQLVRQCLAFRPSEFEQLRIQSGNLATDFFASPTLSPCATMRAFGLPPNLISDWGQTEAEQTAVHSAQVEANTTMQVLDWMFWDHPQPDETMIAVTPVGLFCLDRHHWSLASQVARVMNMSHVQQSLQPRICDLFGREVDSLQAAPAVWLLVLVDPDVGLPSVTVHMEQLEHLQVSVCPELSYLELSLDAADALELWTVFPAEVLLLLGWMICPLSSPTRQGVCLTAIIPQTALRMSFNSLCAWVRLHLFQCITSCSPDEPIAGQMQQILQGTAILWQGPIQQQGHEVWQALSRLLLMRDDSVSTVGVCRPEPRFAGQHHVNGHTPFVIAAQIQLPTEQVSLGEFQFPTQQEIDGATADSPHESDMPHNALRRSPESPGQVSPTVRFQVVPPVPDQALSTMQTSDLSPVPAVAVPPLLDWPSLMRGRSTEASPCGSQVGVFPQAPSRSRSPVHCLGAKPSPVIEVLSSTDEDTETSPSQGGRSRSPRHPERKRTDLGPLTRVRSWTPAQEHDLISRTDPALRDEHREQCYLTYLQELTATAPADTAMVHTTIAVATHGRRFQWSGNLCSQYHIYILAETWRIISRTLCLPTAHQITFRGGTVSEGSALREVFPALTDHPEDRSLQLQSIVPCPRAEVIPVASLAVSSTELPDAAWGSILAEPNVHFRPLLPAPGEPLVLAHLQLLHSGCPQSPPVPLARTVNVACLLKQLQHIAHAVDSPLRPFKVTSGPYALSSTSSLAEVLQACPANHVCTDQGSLLLTVHAERIRNVDIIGPQTRPRENRPIGECHGQPVFFQAGVPPLFRYCPSGPDRETVVIKAYCPEPVVVWQGILPGDVLLQSVLEWWTQACALADRPAQASLLNGPRRVNPDHRLRDMVPCDSTFRCRDGAVLLVIAPYLHGGGVKNENQENTKRQLASLLLDKGIPLQAASQATDSLVSAAGVPALLKIFHLPKQETWPAIQQLAQQVGTNLPEADVTMQRAVKRIQSAVRKKIAARNSPLVGDYSLADDFFLDQDGKPVPSVTSLPPGVRGVMLVSSEEAGACLLQVKGRKFDAEMSLVIWGHTCPDPTTCSGSLQYPVIHTPSQGKAIAAGCVHDVGKRAVQTAASSGQLGTVTVAPTVHCTFSSYRSDHELPSEWLTLAGAPVRTVQGLFRSAGIADAIQQPWGRSFRRLDKPAAPDMSDALQFQGLVPRASLENLLRASGHNRIFVVPRTSSGQIDPCYSVIWAASSREEAAQMAFTLSDQFGLARAKSRYGVRVATAAFQSAYAQLRPDVPVPTRLQLSFMTKLSPMPLGMRPSDIEAWSAALGWPCKVIKALGPRKWLIGSPTAPPQGWLVCNSTPVLSEPVDRKSRRPIIQAADFKTPPQPRTAPTVPTSSTSAEDPWLKSDPWAEARKHQAARGAPGPTSAMDSRVTALEKTIKEIRAQQATAVEEHREVKQQVATLHQNLGDLAVSFKDQLQQSFQVQAASQAQQQLQMNQNISELKELILESRGHKKSKTGDEAMRDRDL